MSADVDVVRRGAVVLARLTGEVDRANTGALHEELAGAVSNETEALVVDLEGLSYLDSSGLHMLVRLWEALRVRGQELRLVVPEDAAVRRVIDVTDMAALLPVHATAAAAGAE